MSVTGININLTLRQIKGSELTYAELDGNQSGLKTAVESHSHDEFAAGDHNHAYADITGAPAAYSLPTASTTVLGGVKVDGTSVVINNGVISSTAVGGGGGVTDHGALTGLTDDDHGQYHTDARGDARYSQISHNHALANLTEKSYNSLTDKPTIPSITGLLDGPAHDLLDHTGLTGIPAAYSLPTASTTVLGGVKVDGTTITITDGVISSNGPGMTNPMTTAGDIIIGGTSGAPTRLAKGTDGQVLTLASGLPAWVAASGGHSPYAFFKSDTTSVAFTKTAAQTLSIKAGTFCLVGDTNTMVSWATATAITMPTHTIGTDYYIYACTDGTVRADANATNPTGYDTSNSRKIGGYHYGRIRNSLTVTDVAVEIVPRSLWDVTYRPKCNPAGMVDVYGNGSLWADIYLCAVDAAITLTAGVLTAGTAKSMYNGTPLTGTEGLHGYNFIELAKNSGKRLLTHSEWLAVAHGSPQGNDGDNLNAWSATTNTARTGAGQVARAVSFCGACDCVGNVWERLGEFSNDHATTSYAWQNPMSTQSVGQLYLPNATGLRQYLAGGSWGYGMPYAGSRSLSTHNYPWNVSLDVGSRFACDGL